MKPVDYKKKFIEAGFHTSTDIDLLMAAAEWYTENKKPHAPMNVFYNRVDICRSCEFFIPAPSPGRQISFCDKCGCGPDKMFNPDQKCPLPEAKWSAVKVVE